MSETTRQRQKRETREKILAAARQQFALHGFSVPTSEIARAAGVAHGSVFAHFPTREELVEGVVAGFFAALNRQMHTLAGEQAGMAALLRAHLAILERDEAFYTRLINELATLPAGARDGLFACQTVLAFHFGQALENTPHVDVPAHMLFNTWVGLVHHYLQNHAMFAPQGKSVLALRGKELMEAYLEMLGGSKFESTLSN